MKPIQMIIASLALGTAVFGQGMDHSKHPMQAAPMKMGNGMGMNMQACMRDMQVGHAKLDALAAKMNKSRGVDRIDATTAVVNQMLANEKAMMKMCMGMMSMHERMGKGMMGGGMGMPGPKGAPSGHGMHHGN